MHSSFMLLMSLLFVVCWVMLVSVFLLDSAIVMFAGVAGKKLHLFDVGMIFEREC